MKRNEFRRRKLHHLIQSGLLLLLLLLLSLFGSTISIQSDILSNSSSSSSSSTPSSTSTSSSSSESFFFSPSSIEFPSLEDTKEMMTLSSIVYQFRHLRPAPGLDTCSDKRTQKALGPNRLCLMYERDAQDTQVILVECPIQNYIAVVFAGTDDLRNWLTDGDILTEPFGPPSTSTSTHNNHTHNHTNKNNNSFVPPSDHHIQVHAGFNNAVFHDGLFDRIQSHIQSTLQRNPHYRLFTSGHSLGAADSILTAVALHQIYPQYSISNINFGSPRTGNRHWRSYVNSLLQPTSGASGSSNLSIWRFVHGIDIVPRLPEMRFVHVGHTIQLGKKNARAYYFHRGDVTKGYRSVPLGWSSKPFLLVPFSIYAHHTNKYIYYLNEKSTKDPKTYFVNSFETLKDNDNDDDNGISQDDNDDDDDGVSQDDDDDENDDEFHPEINNLFELWSKLFSTSSTTSII